MADVTLPDERIALARDASGESMCLIAMLQREAQMEGFDAVLRGALIRLQALASITLSISGGDDGRTTGEMREVIYGY